MRKIKTLCIRKSLQQESKAQTVTLSLLPKDSASHRLNLRLNNYSRLELKVAAKGTLEDVLAYLTKKWLSLVDCHYALSLFQESKEGQTSLLAPSVLLSSLGDKKVKLAYLIGDKTGDQVVKKLKTPLVEQKRTRVSQSPYKRMQQLRDSPLKTVPSEFTEKLDNIDQYMNF